MKFNAIFLIFINRSWQATSGLITALLIINYFNSEEQGWYYAFMSLSSLFVIFELGLSGMLTQYAAHIEIYKNKQKDKRYNLKFYSFINQSINKYINIIIIFLIISIVIGEFFFKNFTKTLQLQWIAFIVLSGISFIAIPILSILEGINLIKEVYCVRLMNGIIGSIICWLIIINGGSLWSILALPSSAIIINFLWLFYFQKEIIGEYKESNLKNFNWNVNIKKLRRWVGVSWISTYMTSQLSTPIIFYKFGPVLAGKFGLTITLIHMIGHLSQVLLINSVPIMSNYVLNKEWIKLKLLGNKCIQSFVFIYTILSFTLLIAYKFLMPDHFKFKLISYNEIVALIVFVFFYQITVFFTLFLRSFKKEPISLIYLMGAIFTVINSLMVQNNQSTIDIINIMLYSQLGIVFPFSIIIFIICKSRWIHS